MTTQAHFNQMTTQERIKALEAAGYNTYAAVSLLPRLADGEMTIEQAEFSARNLNRLAQINEQAAAEYAKNERQSQRRNEARVRLMSGDRQQGDYGIILGAEDE